MAICSFTFGMSLLYVNGGRAVIVALMFFAITVAKILRLIRSLAYDATLRASRETQDQ